MCGSIFCFSSWCLFLFLSLSCFLSLLCHFPLTGPSRVYSFFRLPAPSFVYSLVTVLSQLFEVIPHQVYVRAKMYFHSKCIVNCPIGPIRYCILLCGFPYVAWTYIQNFPGQCLFQTVSKSLKFEYFISYLCLPVWSHSLKQHKILLLDHVSHTIFASDILKTRFKEPCLLWQFVCPYIYCNSFPTSRMSRTGGVCNDCVPIGWKLEVTLPLGRAGEVTERLKRTQSIWTLQTDRPKPKSQLYHLQARELPSTELVFAHQSALPSSPGSETEPAVSPLAAGACHPLVCNTTGAHGLAHSKIASCQQPHVPLCYLHLQAWPTPEPLSPLISLPLTPPAPGSLSCNTQSKPLTHTTPVAQAGVLTRGGGQ